MLSIVRRPDFVSDYDFGGVVQRVERETGLHIQDSNAPLALDRFSVARRRPLSAGSSYRPRSRPGPIRAGGVFICTATAGSGIPNSPTLLEEWSSTGKPLGRAYRPPRLTFRPGVTAGCTGGCSMGSVPGPSSCFAEPQRIRRPSFGRPSISLISARDTTEPFQFTARDLPEPLASQFTPLSEGARLRSEHRHNY